MSTRDSQGWCALSLSSLFFFKNPVMNTVKSMVRPVSIYRPEAILKLLWESWVLMRQHEVSYQSCLQWPNSEATFMLVPTIQLGWQAAAVILQLRGGEHDCLALCLWGHLPETLAGPSLWLVRSYLQVIKLLLQWEGYSLPLLFCHSNMITACTTGRRATLCLCSGVRMSR